MAGGRAPDSDYWEAHEDCIVCGGEDYAAGHGPRTLVTCDCCLAKGVHIECWQQRSGEVLTQEQLALPAFQWFCSEGCKRVNARMVGLTGVQRPVAGAAGAEYSVELVRWSPRDLGEQKKVSMAKQLFNSAFAPLVMENGRNLIDMVCEAFESADDPLEEAQQKEQQQQAAAHGKAGSKAGGKAGSKTNGSDSGGGGRRGRAAVAKEGCGGAAAGGDMEETEDGSGQEEEEDEDDDDEPESYNFSTFRVLLLRKRGTVVSAATLRAFGNRFCEVPFVATREGYRRNGCCRMLMQEVEGMLHGMGVQWVVLPAMKGILAMWLRKFNYMQFSQSECEVLGRRIVMPDPTSAVLVRKQVEAPQTEGGTGARKGTKARAPAPKIGRRVRFSYAEPNSSDEESDEGGKGVRRGGGKRKGGKAKKEDAAEGVSDYEMSEEDEDEEDEEDEGVEGVEGLCERCGATQSEGWIISQATEETLCANCVTSEDISDTPAASAAAAAAGAAAGAASSKQGHTGAAKSGEGGKVCSNCGSLGGSQSRTTGIVECTACSRWRANHNGEPRPPKQWVMRRQRSQAKAAGTVAGGAAARPAGAGTGGAGEARQAASRPTIPASRGGASAAAAAAAAPRTPAASKQQQQRQAQGARASQRVLRMFKLSRGQAGRQAQQARASAEVHRLQVEELMGEQLGGHLVYLVREADQQQAQMQHEYEQRALKQRASLVAAEAGQHALRQLAESLRGQVDASEAREAAAAARAQQLQGMLDAAAHSYRQHAVSFQAELAAERAAAAQQAQQLTARLAAAEAEAAAAQAEAAEHRRQLEASQAEKEAQIEQLLSQLQLGQQQQQQQQVQQQPETEPQQAPEGQPAGVCPGDSSSAGALSRPAQAAQGTSAECDATAEGFDEPIGMSFEAGEPEPAGEFDVELPNGSPLTLAAAPVHSPPLASASAQGLSLPSPAASAGGSGGTQAPRRRLTTGRTSGGHASGRRRMLRSRPAPSGGDAGSGGASQQEQRQGTECASGGTSQQMHQQQQGQGAGGEAAGAGSEDWGRALFGMLGPGTGGSSGSGDGVAVGDSSQLPAGWTGGTAGAARQASSPPDSPSMSLDGVHGQGGMPGVAAAGLRLRLALGSQESCSQGGQRQQAQHAQHAQQPDGATPVGAAGLASVPHPGGAATPQATAATTSVPAAGPALAAHGPLAGPGLDDLFAMPAAGGGFATGGSAAAGDDCSRLGATHTAGVARFAGSAAAGFGGAPLGTSPAARVARFGGFPGGSPEAGQADQEEAMRAAADIAQYLAD